MVHMYNMLNRLIRELRGILNAITVLIPVHIIKMGKKSQTHTKYASLFFILLRKDLSTFLG